MSWIKTFGKDQILAFQYKHFLPCCLLRLCILLHLYHFLRMTCAFIALFSRIRQLFPIKFVNRYSPYLLSCPSRLISQTPLLQPMKQLLPAFFSFCFTDNIRKSIGNREIVIVEVTKGSNSTMATSVNGKLQVLWAKFLYLFLRTEILSVEGNFITTCLCRCLPHFRGEVLRSHHRLRVTCYSPITVLHSIEQL